jgi:hypothetical protein
MQTSNTSGSGHYGRTDLIKPSVIQWGGIKDIAPTLWGIHLYSIWLKHNVSQTHVNVRKYLREQLCNWSKVGRSLGLTCGGQNVSLLLCMYKWDWMRVRERNPSQGPSLSLVSLTQERDSLI